MRDLDRGHITPVSCERPFQRRGGGARRREQGINKAAGFFRVQMNLIAVLDDLACHFAAVRNDKRSHRAPLNRGRLFEELPVRSRHACDEAVGLGFFDIRWHAHNVCLCGTHCKGGFLTAM
jgi:hypothetical protein